MAGETLITIIGNLVGDVDLRFTNSGAPVANFTIASTPRNFDRETREWRDGDTLFMRCSVWRDQAENVAESLTKGTRVIAQGRLVQRNWETPQGEKRSAVELQVEDIGPALRFATAQVRRPERTNQQAPQYATAPQQQAAPAGGATDDPWAQPMTGASYDPEPPF